MPRCICHVIGCNTRAHQDLNSFFRIPKIPSKGSPHIIKLKTERHKKWISALRRKDLTEEKVKNVRICDKHFINGRPSALVDVDNPDWVPSLLMGYETNSNVALPTTSQKAPLVGVLPSPVEDWYNQIKEITEAERIREITERTLHGAPSSLDDDRINSSEETSDHVNTETGVKNVETQTDLRMDNINNMLDVIKAQTLEICDLYRKLDSYVDNAEDSVNPAALLEFTMDT